MVKHDKREIEQLKHVFEDMPDYEYIGCCEKGDEAVKKIAEEAEARGIKSKTLWNAKRELEIDSVKRGKQWYWMLPE